NNIAATTGGALDNYFYDSNTKNDSINIENTVFDGNKANEGGAIYNHVKGGRCDVDGTISLNSSTFVNNSSNKDGGAIHNSGILEVSDTSFSNNTAGGKGGAIFTNSDLTINAINKNVVFSGNKSVDGNDIYMNTEKSVLNINAADNKSVTIASGISGNNYQIMVNSGENNTGSLIINSEIKNAAIAVQNGSFHLAQGSVLNNSQLNMANGTTLSTVDNKISSFGDNITLGDNVNLVVDVNLANKKTDNFEKANVEGNVIITSINTLGNTKANNVSVNIIDALGINSSNVTISETLQQEVQKVLTPIRYLKGSIDETGLLAMAPTGNGYKDFNPSVLAAPVAALTGGYLSQLNSYDQAFQNMDMYMLMTYSERQALKNANKTADANSVYNPSFYLNLKAKDSNDAWFRPYASFEKVNLSHGPKVSNTMYGSYFGGDSKIYSLKHGWDGMYSLYVGYNGSHQSYNGISITQNGVTLGFTGIAYKGNLFSGLTVNVGANIADAGTKYGSEDFTMLLSGAAWKTGYNFEMANGKFIIQPSVLVSYSFINTFDYTNAAGIRIKSDPLNAIQVQPGVKLIGNLKRGWQPYAGINLVWNFLDDTRFKANDVSLPELSTKPFIRYSIGVQKKYGQRFTGFGQIFFNTIGRSGIGFSFGFKWALGKNNIKLDEPIYVIPKN
ncbi:MAG: autotransporter outer membrane beta-barrel domain-containing protein, partial [Candidatus Gastranaerophilales bacterium]|nr:autotransporter outer membrane beta-barrel domain-containing protein [Candidatus Gastranaerophilales bacterium]